MYSVYILKNESSNGYYIGHTSDINRRLKEHNRTRSHFTKNGSHWECVYMEEFELKAEAIQRERQIKRMKSRKYIENLISKVR